MKKIQNFLFLFLFVFAFAISGCGNADVDGKGSANETPEMDPEQKKLRDQVMKKAPEQK